jgi:hypothetical protein
MANKKVSQLTSKPAVNLTDLFLIADPTSGQAFKTTISDLGTAIGSGVSSVNTLVGAVVLDTDDIQELVSPTNKWFTDTRARAAISAGTGISYNSGTGVITNAVTSGQIATALGYTPANGADYLPLAGGTMGGAIFGTIATFASSTSVTALGITLSGGTGDGVKITHSAGRAFNIQSSGTGFGILINNETASTSAPFTIQKQGLAVITLTDAGAGTFASTITANGATLTGALNGTSAIFTGDLTLSASNPRLYLTDTDNNPDYFISNTDGTFTIYDVTNSTSRLTISTLNTILNTNLRVDGDVLIKQDSVLGGVSGYTAIASDTDGIFLKLGTASAHAYLVLSSLTNYRNFTFPDATGTLALTSNLASYLPLAGGTLTGALSGTSATFSGSVTSNGTLIAGLANGNIRLKGSADGFLGVGESNGTLYLTDWATGAKGLSILLSTGAATFSSSVTATQGFIRGDLGTGVEASLRLRGSNSTARTTRLQFEDYNGTIADAFIDFKIPTAGSGTGARLDIGVNSPALTIVNGGNVGIGTTDPQTILNGFSSSARGMAISNAYPFLALNDTDGGNFFIGTQANLGYIWNAGSDALIIATNNAERMRITSGGQVSQTAPLADWSNIINNTNVTNPYGLYVLHSGNDKNGTGNQFLYCVGGSTLRAEIRSNGGLANYQANNVNLSDERTKKEISPLESYWNKFKAMEIVKFKYKDQTHDDFNIGVIAQQVESVAPEFVDIDGWGETRNDESPLKSIYTADLYHASIGVLKEAMAKIETLEAEIQTLKNK